MSRKILILDDNKDFVQIMGEHLSENFDCVTSTSGPDALDKLVDPSFRLVVTDYSMPDMNGDEFLKLLRASGNLVPVIFLTGELTLELALNALRMGAMDLMEKPVSLLDLEKAINRVIYIDKRRRDYFAAIDGGQALQPDKTLGLLFVSIAESAAKKTG